jgi:hypothetical protein
VSELTNAHDAFRAAGQVVAAIAEGVPAFASLFTKVRPSLMSAADPVAGHPVRRHPSNSLRSGNFTGKLRCMAAIAVRPERYQSIDFCVSIKLWRADDRSKRTT